MLRGEVRWRPLLPTALLTGVGSWAYTLAATLWMPRAIARHYEQFGSFGIALDFVTWFTGFAFLVIGAAVLGPVLAEGDNVIGRWLRRLSPLLWSLPRLHHCRRRHGPCVCPMRSVSATRPAVVSRRRDQRGAAIPPRLACSSAVTLAFSSSWRRCVRARREGQDRDEPYQSACACGAPVAAKSEGTGGYGATATRPYDFSSVSALRCSS